MSICGSVLRVEMLKGSKGATGLKNEPGMLVFEGGDGVGVGEEQAPLKTSIRGSFSRVVMVVVLKRRNRPQKRR